MNRREFVGCIGVAFVLPFAGCLDGVSPYGTTDGDGNTTGETDEQNDDTGNRTDDSDSYTYDESRRDPIFIENTTETEAVVDVSVERKSDGSVLIENTYAVPPKTGIEIPSIAEVENEYRVTAKYNGEVDTFDWTVLTCAHEAGPDVGGETALGVEITDDELRIFHTDCDIVGAGDNRNLTYEYHEAYVKDD